MTDLRIELGEAVGLAPKPALMDIKELLQTRLLVQGNSGSGKSYLLRRLLEQSAALVQQVVIDPEGDFVTLSEHYSHVVIDANRSEADLVLIAEKVRASRVSCVLDLSKLEVAMQMKAAALFLNTLFDAHEQHWNPALVAVDEAQLFAPSASGDVDEAARKASLTAMTNLMCRGRKRGLCGIIATQRLAKLAKNVAAEASNFLMGRTFLDIDMERAADLLGINIKQADMFRNLEQGRFIALGPALSRTPITIKIGAVITTARKATPDIKPPPKKLDEAGLTELLAPAPVALRSFAVRVPTPQAADTGAIIETVGATEQAQHAVEEEEQAGAPPESQSDRDKTYRDILAGIMENPQSNFEQETALYQEFIVTCRLQKAPRIELVEFRKYLPAARAGLDGATAAEPEWQSVLAVAREMPLDLQPVYLLLARAAKAREPCPPDLAFARTCASMSPGRGRSRVEALEKQAYITVRKDMRGMRVVTIPDFVWETEPGDPTAPAPVA